MEKINLIRDQHPAGIFPKGTHQRRIAFLAFAFLVISLTFYVFCYWKLDCAQEEVKRLSKQIATIDVANRKVLAARQADTNAKLEAFLEQVSIHEATGAVITIRKIFLLFPSEGVQIDKISFGAKEVVIAGIASDFGVITNYIKTLRNNIASLRNLRLVSAKQRLINGRKVHEFLMRCEREEKLP